MREVIKTDRAPEAIGPYSQAIVVKNGGLIFTAGQLGLDPETGQFVEGGIQEQTRQALENIKGIVEAAGSNMNKIIKTTVFLKDIDDFAEMNAVYATFFANDPPARSAIQAAKLPKDALVEIEAIAIIND